MEIPVEIPHMIFEKKRKKYVHYFTYITYQNGNVDDPISAYEKRDTYGRR